MNWWKLAVVFCGVVLCASLPLLAQQKRPITPKDCVTMRDFTYDQNSWRSTVRISPDGKRIAYLVKAPNLQANTNDIELYVTEIGTEESASQPVMEGELTSLQWMADNRHLAFLVREQGKRVIALLDITTGKHRTLVDFDRDIEEYSIDSVGDTIAFSSEFSSKELAESPTPQESARGYHVPSIWISYSVVLNLAGFLAPGVLLRMR